MGARKLTTSRPDSSPTPTPRSLVFWRARCTTSGSMSSRRTISPVSRASGATRASFCTRRSTSAVGAYDLGSTQNDHENAAVVDGLRKAGFTAQMNVLAASVTRDLEAQAKLPGIFVQGCGATINRLPQFTSEQIARPENRYAG